MGPTNTSGADPLCPCDEGHATRAKHLWNPRFWGPHNARSPLSPLHLHGQVERQVSASKVKIPRADCGVRSALQTPKDAPTDVAEGAWIPCLPLWPLLQKFPPVIVLALNWIKYSKYSLVTCKVGPSRLGLQRIAQFTVPCHTAGTRAVMLQNQCGRKEMPEPE